jgi:methylenetetrahydrofolate dehydrogenase (NADP+)/methenyltetrahydrofolate cyclohydrolase
MKLVGKELAVDVYKDIQKKIVLLGKAQIIPRLVIVKSLNIDAVNNYIYQKVKKGKKIGINVEILELSNSDCNNRKRIQNMIVELSSKKTIHGIIFQKPSNVHVNDELEHYIAESKDVDGFLLNSFHKPPVYRGVMKVLGTIFNLSDKKLIPFLKNKSIVLIGKGKTGGGTVIAGLKKDGFNIELLTIIDSKTSEIDKVKCINRADIIISAVGKQNPVDFHLFPKKAILIDIGVHFSEQNKIKGDFNEEDIKSRVTYYTTTPGGLGALTVAYLMDNTVNSALQTITNSKEKL